VNKVYRLSDTGSDIKPGVEQPQSEIMENNYSMEKLIAQKNIPVESEMSFEGNEDQFIEKVEYKQPVNETTQPSRPVVLNRGLSSKVSELKNNRNNISIPTSIGSYKEDKIQVSRNNKNSDSTTLNRVTHSQNQISRRNSVRVTPNKEIVDTGSSDISGRKVNVGDESLSQNKMRDQQTSSEAFPVTQSKPLRSSEPNLEFPVQRSFKAALPLTVSNNSEYPGLLADKNIGNSYRDTPVHPLPLDMPMAGSGLVKADGTVQSDIGVNRMTSIVRSNSSNTGNQTTLSGKGLHQLSPSRQNSSPVLSKASAVPSEIPKNESNESKPDLRALARELYPYLKRMIIIDRERMSK
jgi:hypothetical protein